MSFELEPGEKQLGQEPIQLVEGRRMYPGTLILTNRRAVVTYRRPPRPWMWVFGFFIIYALFKSVASRVKKERVRHQIKRDRFGSVEGDSGILVFHDQGEGYAHTSFAVQSRDPLSLWKARMQRWAAATDDGPIEPAPLPTARLVDR